MPKLDLEDAESYLVKQIDEDLISLTKEGLIRWVRECFAELRAREAAKEKG